MQKDPAFPGGNWWREREFLANGEKATSGGKFIRLRFNDKLFRELCRCHRLCVCVVYWSPAILHASRTVPSFKFLQPKQAQPVGEGPVASAALRLILDHYLGFSSSGKKTSSVFHPRRCSSGFWSHRPLSKEDEGPGERQISKNEDVLGADVWGMCNKCLRTVQNCSDSHSEVFVDSCSAFSVQISLCWPTPLTANGSGRYICSDMGILLWFLLGPR